MSFLILLVIILQRFNSPTIYYNKDGIRILDMWFRYRKLSWDKIISIDFLKFRNDAGKELNGLLIEFDDEWTRLVNTGLKNSAIALTEDAYYLQDYKTIEKQVAKFRREFMAKTDTLNERLRKQVMFAWKSRHRRMVLESIAKFEFLLIPLLLLELIANTFMLTPPIVLLAALSTVALSYFLLIEFTNLPYSIVGIRGSELGAVLHNPDELLSNIRFIFIACPYPVELISAEMIYDEGKVKQISNFIQIHPQRIDPGVLTHGNAQISGNHTHSAGMTITFKLNQEQFKLPVVWKEE